MFSLHSQEGGEAKSCHGLALLCPGDAATLEGNLMQLCYSRFPLVELSFPRHCDCGLQQLPISIKQLPWLQVLTLAAGPRTPCPKHGHGSIVSETPLHDESLVAPEISSLLPGSRLAIPALPCISDRRLCPCSRQSSSAPFLSRQVRATTPHLNSTGRIKTTTRASNGLPAVAHSRRDKSKMQTGMLIMQPRYICSIESGRHWHCRLHRLSEHPGHAALIDQTPYKL